jgi:hypothetical protein
MGATSSRNLKNIYFSRSVRVSSPAEAIEYQTLGNYILSDECFRLLQHISNARLSSKFRVLGEKEHVETKLLNSRTHFDHLESIEISTNLGKALCRKNIFECSNGSKPINIRVATVLSKLRYTKPLRNLILNYALFLFDVLSGIIYVRYIICLNFFNNFLSNVCYQLVDIILKIRSRS